MRLDLPYLYLILRYIIFKDLILLLLYYEEGIIGFKNE